MKIFTLLLLVSSLAWGSEFSQNIEKTFREAKKEKKPIIIDFFGIWCPPCNELDETVFESTDFLQKAKAFKLLKVDADADSSWKIKDRYKIGGYPTILFTDSTGNEVYRITGYRGPNEFLRIMDVVLKAKGKPLDSACKSTDPEDLWRCAVICSEREEKNCVEASLKKLEKVLSPGSARYELARTLAVENSATEDLKRDGYEKLMQEYPATPQALLWAYSYWDLFGSETKQKPKTKLVEQVLTGYPGMLLDRKQEELGISRTDMAMMRADLLEKMGKIEEAKTAWKEAAVLFEKLSAQLPKKMAARGFTLERISCLENSGDLEGALKLSNSYREKFPKEFTFHYASSGILERQKKYTEALPLAKKAYEFSYGDNKVRVATLLIRIHGALVDKPSATKILDEVTKEVKPSAELNVRTHRYLLKMQEAYLKIPPQ